MDNELDNELDNGETTKGNVIEIPDTKTYILGGKVITMSPKKEAQALAGENLTRKELKDSIVAVVKNNGKEKEENGDKEKKINPKKVLALALVPFLLFSLAKGCSKKENQPIIETKKIQEIIYQLDNPYPILEGIVNTYGQEGMTANGIEGNAFDGEYYSWEEQTEAETRASEGTFEFEEIQQERDKNIEILTSATTSQQEKETASRRLLELAETVKQIFEDNEDFAKDYAERFKQASLAYKDSNTENEIITIDQMVENYMAEMGLSSQNVEAIKEIVDAFEQGYEVEIEGEKQVDGDYLITVEGIREVAANEGINKSVWQKFKDFLKGDRQQNISKDTSDFEK